MRAALAFFFFVGREGGNSVSPSSPKEGRKALVVLVPKFLEVACLTEDVEDADEGPLGPGPRLPGDRRRRRVEDDVDLPVDPREQLPVHVLQEREEILLGLRKAKSAVKGYRHRSLMSAEAPSCLFCGTYTIDYSATFRANVDSECCSSCCSSSSR